MPRHHSGIIQKCPHCRIIFPLCLPCSKFRRYCSILCSAFARKTSKKEAKRRHQRSEAGRLKHAEHQRSYRQRRRLKKDSVRGQTCAVKPVNVSGIDRDLSVPHPPPTSVDWSRCLRCGCGPIYFNSQSGLQSHWNSS